MDYRKLLERSYEIASVEHNDSKFEYLSNYIFDFTTYDGEIDELFAKKAIEVCSAINTKTNFGYQESPENYIWYLVMCNMPFFADKLDWGTSIRGAWWIYDDIILESVGLYDDEGEQILEMTFNKDQWHEFIDSISAFCNVEK